MRVRFTIDALAHIAEIHSYIDARNSAAATHVVGRIRAAAERLGEFPELGRNGALTGTREWVVTGLPYIIVYEREAADELTVLGIYHGAQTRPGQE